MKRSRSASHGLPLKRRELGCIRDGRRRAPSKDIPGPGALNRPVGDVPAAVRRSPEEWVLLGTTGPDDERAAVGGGGIG